ncbi:MAG: PAS domain S-box protein [Chloroflexi bacterium]|nr:PAS domain S-box protein [Chloroflexota bacterium]
MTRDVQARVGITTLVIFISLGLVILVSLLLPLLTAGTGLLILFLVIATAVSLLIRVVELTRVGVVLRESETRFRSIVESVPVGMHTYRLSPDGRLIFTGANPAADSILGVDNRQFIGKTIEEAFPGLVDTPIPQIYRRLAQSGGVWHADRFVYRSGSLEGIYEINAFQTAPGHMATAFLDITERIRAAEALAASEEKFRLLVEHSPAGVFMIDNNFHFTYVNEETARIAERPASAMVGLDFRELLPSETRDAIVDLYRRRQRGESVSRRYELDILTPSGQTRRVELVVSLIANSGSVYSIGQAVDITDRLRAERERVEVAVEKERLDLLRTFISNISHDLKTPLTIIQTSLFLIERHTDPQKRQEKIEMIRMQANLLNRLIQDLLMISRLDYLPEPNLDLLDLNELVQQVEEQFRLPIEKKRLEVQVQLDPALRPVNADREALNRAITNLIENAVNYTPDDHAISIRTAQHNNAAVVTVSDTGMGIEPDVLPLIFNRFYRSPKAREVMNGGSGLGLAIVQRVAEMHGGHVEVDSAPGQGSTFRLFLPLQSSV